MTIGIHDEEIKNRDTNKWLSLLFKHSPPRIHETNEYQRQLHSLLGEKYERWWILCNSNKHEVWETRIYYYCTE